MSRLSIIIPVQGDWQALETSLVSVLENRPPRSEIVVVLDREYQDPYDLKDEVAFVRAPGRPSLVDLLNLGIAAAHYEILHPLLSGATVSEGWATAAMRHFNDPRAAAVAPLVLDASCPQRILLAGCNWSQGGGICSFGAGHQADDLQAVGRQWVGPAFIAAFYRRSAVAEVGSLDATLSPQLAAVDLALRLRRSGHGAALETGSRVSMEPARIISAGPFQQARDCERVFWRHARCRGWRRSVAAHGGTILAEALRSIPRLRTAWQLAGRVVGACDPRRPPQTTAAPADAARRVVAGGETRVDAKHTTPPARQGARPPSSQTTGSQITGSQITGSQITGSQITGSQITGSQAAKSQAVSSGVGGERSSR